MKWLDKKFDQLVHFVKRLFSAQSVTIQIITTVIFFFVVFFMVQLILNKTLFPRYYTLQEFEDISLVIDEYHSDLQKNPDNYYDVMYEFLTRNNAYSVITSNTYNIVSSGYNNYSIEIANETSTYNIDLPNELFDINIGDSVTVSINETSMNNYVVHSLKTDSFTYEEERSCDTCFLVQASITKIYKPFNLNYLYSHNKNVSDEIEYISTSFNFDENRYNNGWWYKTTSSTTNQVIFINEINAFEHVVTIVPIANTNTITSVLFSYSLFIYFLTVIVLSLWSFRLTSLLSFPLERIKQATESIAALNFDIHLDETANSDVLELSESVNKIAYNLNNVLNLVSAKNETLKEQYKKQEQEVTLKKQLVSSISHELKTPLMVMQVTIQGILDGIIDKKDLEMELDNVLLEINKSSVMIQDMLQIYRLDNDSKGLSYEHINLSDLVEKTIKEFKHSFKQYKFDLKKDITEDLYIDADKNLILRVISNYITNAIKYTPHGNKIHIEVKNNPISFSITNYGVSINEAELDKIWLPFYRSESHSERLPSKGSGVGLYLVSEVLKAHNYNFGIVNTEDGVKAYFDIPNQ